MLDTLLNAAQPLIRIKEWREPRPYGSTVSYETMQDILLMQRYVVVRVDSDDLLPVECEGSIQVGDWEGRLRFSLPQVGRRDGKLFVTYDCEVIDG